MLAVDVEAADLCAGLSEEQLSRSLRAGRWSITQNLAHLRTTTLVLLSTVDLALAESERGLRLSRRISQGEKTTGNECAGYFSRATRTIP
jgi:hypothetical protein